MGNHGKKNDWGLACGMYISEMYSVLVAKPVGPLRMSRWRWNESIGINLTT
jgi:hypothetical protein